MLAVTSAGLLPQPHYSSASAVSSQSIVRHDEGHGQRLIAGPLAKVAVASPVHYASAPVAYHSAPAHYSSAAVSSQNIVRHDEQLRHATKLVAAAPVHYAAPAPVHYAAPAQVHYAPAPVQYAAPIAKVLAPAHKILAHAEEYVSNTYHSF